LTKALCEGEALGSKARQKANLVDPALHSYVVSKPNTPACPSKPVSERKAVRKIPTVKAQAYREAVSLAINIASTTDMMDVSEASIVFEQQNTEERAQGDLRGSVALPVQSSSTASASFRKTATKTQPTAWASGADLRKRRTALERKSTKPLATTVAAKQVK
jgi:hypothetical protein